MAEKIKEIIRTWVLIDEELSSDNDLKVNDGLNFRAFFGNESNIEEYTLTTSPPDSDFEEGVTKLSAYKRRRKYSLDGKTVVSETEKIDFGLFVSKFNESNLVDMQILIKNTSPIAPKGSRTYGLLYPNKHYIVLCQTVISKSGESDTLSKDLREWSGKDDWVEVTGNKGYRDIRLCEKNFDLEGKKRFETTVSRFSYQNGLNLQKSIGGL
jgi:hypothetical protein